MSFSTLGKALRISDWVINPLSFPFEINSSKMRAFSSFTVRIAFFLTFLPAFLETICFFLSAVYPCFSLLMA